MALLFTYMFSMSAVTFAVDEDLGEEASATEGSTYSQTGGGVVDYGKIIVCHWKFDGDFKDYSGYDNHPYTVCDSYSELK